MSTQKTLSWQAPEFRHYEKSAAWYATLLAVTVVIAAFFLFLQHDVFATVSILAIAALVVYFSRQKPEIVTVELTGKQVRVGPLGVPYRGIKHFWIVSDHEHRVLNFETTAWLNNHLEVMLGDQDTEAVRSFLLEHLPEHHETTPTFAQKIAHKLKF